MHLRMHLHMHVTYRYYECCISYALQQQTQVSQSPDKFIALVEDRLTRWLPQDRPYNLAKSFLIPRSQ